MPRSLFPFLLVAAIAAQSPAQEPTPAAERALAVSPGSPTGALIGETCPTFNWGAVRDAHSYELVVYNVGEEREEREQPVLRETFAGSVTGWTPALDRCLARGGRYAWTVRARGRDGSSGWSAPSLFRIAPGPGDREVEAALELVRGYLDARARDQAPVTGAPAAAGNARSAATAQPAAAPEPRAAAPSVLTVDQGVEAASFKGDGSGLTSLDPANLAAGTAAIDISGTAATAGDADTVDGSHASAFVPAAGGLMTGTLTLSPSLGNALLVTQGNVGVGTKTPASRVHIEGGTTVWPLRVEGSENLLLADGEGAVGDATRMVQFSNGAGKSLVFMGSGRVGIGTLSPANHLEVFSEDTAALKINKGGTGGASEEADLIFEHEGSQIINYYNGSKLSWFKSPNDLVTIENDGDVGIGTSSPANKLQVAGDIRVGIGTNGCVRDADGTVIAGSCSSDLRLKKNVRQLSGLLDRVTRLTPVRFDWRSEEFPELVLGTETQLGLIAQDVERVLPELVAEDEDGFKLVRYHDLPIYLLQALREQQQENEALRNAVSELAARLQVLEH